VAPVTRLAEPIGAGKDAPAQVRRIVRRCEPHGQLEQLGGGCRRSPRMHTCRSLLDDGGNLPTGPCGGKRKMSRSLLSSRHQLSQARVKSAFLRRRRTRHHSGTQEGMREAETLILDLEDTRLERVGQSGLRPPAGGHLDEAHGRVGEQGNDPRNLHPGSPEPIEALLNEVCQIRRNGQLRARI
jgi:hypothetical protein